MTRRPKPTTGLTKTTAGHWPPETRARAVELYRTQGLATTAAQLNIPKSTIRGWAAAAGVDSAAAAARSAEQTREATEASLVRRRQLVAEAKEEAVSRLAGVTLQALQLEAAMLEAHAGVLRAAASGVVSAEAAGLLSAATSGHRLTEVVGSRTRAIHDLQLLTESPTEQPAGGLTIVFATPPPAAAAGSPRIIDLALEA